MTTTAKQAQIARVIETKETAVAIELFNKWMNRAQAMLEVLGTAEHKAAVQSEIELYSKAIEQLQAQQEQQALEAAQYNLQHNLHSSYYSALAMVDDYFNPRRTLLQSLSAEQITAKLSHCSSEVGMLSAELDRVQELIDSQEAAVC